ncbi:unnamed protein product [Dicrocoelium dendriticum]|nr:unnamed protein product [Dicrocoelium dendriticum]
MRLRFGGRLRCRCDRIDTSQLAKPAVLNAYQSRLSCELDKRSLGAIEAHWSHVHQTLLAAGKSSCGMSNHQHGFWVSSQSLELVDARRHIPAGSEHNETRKELRAKLRASLKRDRESWLLHFASEMEMAAALCNHDKLFCLIRETGSRRPGVSESICDVSGQPICNLSKHLERWAEHFARQFNRLELFDFSPATDRPAPWAVPLDPLSGPEAEREIGLLKSNKAAGPVIFFQPSSRLGDLLLWMIYTSY